MTEDEDRLLRASVPERWKGCTSPIGAVQSYIAELEQPFEVVIAGSLYQITPPGREPEGRPRVVWVRAIDTGRQISIDGKPMFIIQPDHPGFLWSTMWGSGLPRAGGRAVSDAEAEKQARAYLESRRGLPLAVSYPPGYMPGN